MHLKTTPFVGFRMLARLGVIVVFGVVILSLMTVETTLGITRSVGVIVLVDPAGARFGDRISVTALVFDAGSAADPSNISAVVDKLPGVTPLPLARQSVGVFTGTFAFESHPSVVRVNATVAGTSDSGAATVYNRGPSVRVMPSKGTAAPGDRISVGVEVRDLKGSLQDADSLNLAAQIGEAPGFERWSSVANLSWTRIAVGQYSAQYTVPWDLVRDSIVHFWADVVTGTGGGGAGASVYVIFPDALLVWYRMITIGGDNATLELSVASSSGLPLPNVMVSLLTSPFFGTDIRREGVTGPAGAIRFDIPLASVPAQFYGNATLGSERQSFRGALDLPAPSPEGARLLRENPSETFEVGQTAVLRLRLVRDGAPVSDQDLFAYAHTTSRVLLVKRLSTDGEGRFEIRFVAPPESVRVEVNGNISGVWEVFHPAFFATSRIDASVTSEDGWNFTLSLRFPRSPGPWQARLSLSAAEEAVLATWWASGPFGPERIVGGSGDSVSVPVSLPRFLPAGSVISVSIWAESFSGSYGEAQLTFVAGVPIQRPLDVGVLAILFGFGLLFTVAASGWRLPRISKRRL